MRSTAFKKDLWRMKGGREREESKVRHAPMPLMTPPVMTTNLQGVLCLRGGEKEPMVSGESRKEC